MIYALVGRNLRHLRGVFLALALGFFGFEILIIQAVEAFDLGGAGFAALVEQLPPLMRGFLSSQLEFISFASGVAFGFQHPVVLAASVALVLVAATIPAAERESALLDLVLARPVPRNRYLAGVLVTVILAAALPGAAELLGAAAGLTLANPPAGVSWRDYGPVALQQFALLLAVGGFSLLMAAGAARRGQAAARTTAVLVALYLLEALGGLWRPLASLRPYNPFHYFNPVLVVMQPPAPLKNLVILLSIFAACTAVAFVRFRRRDV